MALIQPLDEIHSLKEEWDWRNIALVQTLDKGHSPKEEWDLPNIALL